MAAAAVMTTTTSGDGEDPSETAVLGLLGAMFGAQTPLGGQSSAGSHPCTPVPLYPCRKPSALLSSAHLSGATRTRRSILRADPKWPMFTEHVDCL